MAEYIDDLDVYAGSSHQVAVSPGRRVMKKVHLQARVDTETGEVTFYVPLDKIDTLRNE